MFICLDCGKFFDDPVHYTEQHNLECPPYEEYDGCPYCAGAFAYARRCDCCDKWIEGDYIKTDNGKRFCDHCFCNMSLGDED